MTTRVPVPTRSWSIVSHKNITLPVNLSPATVCGTLYSLSNPPHFGSSSSSKGWRKSPHSSQKTSLPHKEREGERERERETTPLCRKFLHMRVVMSVRGGSCFRVVQNSNPPSERARDKNGHRHFSLPVATTQFLCLLPLCGYSSLWALSQSDKAR